MNKKFTEDQYQEIVDIWESQIAYVGAMQEVINYLDTEKIVGVTDKALALANPLTRDQAYNKYVSDLYLWHFYLPTGEAMSLYQTDISDDIYFGIGEEATPFSENELKNSPIYDENGDKTELDLSMFKKVLVNEEKIPF